MATVKEMVTELYNLYARVASLEYENELLKANNLKALQSTEYVWDKTFEVEYGHGRAENATEAMQSLVQKMLDCVAPKVYVKTVSYQQYWGDNDHQRMRMWMTVGAKDEATIL